MLHGASERCCDVMPFFPDNMEKSNYNVLKRGEYTGDKEGIT